MAVKSSTSAELIAVSSLLTFGVHKPYYRPDTGSQTLVRVSHWGIALYAIVLAVFYRIQRSRNKSHMGSDRAGRDRRRRGTSRQNDATLGAPWISFCCGITVWVVRLTSDREPSMSLVPAIR
jgi:hypothetical protein